MTPPDELSLAGLFEPGSRDEWRAAVAAALVRSGRLAPHDDPAAAERLLTTTTYDGIGIRPLYTRDDAVGDDTIGVPGLAPFVRGRRVEGNGPAGWDVRALHQHPDPALTHEAVLTDLENGVTSLWLKDLPVGCLRQVLDGVLLDLAPVVLDAGANTAAAARELRALLPGSGAAEGNWGADPIGLRARLGPGHDPDLTLLHDLASNALGLRAAMVDVTVYHDAGAGDAQELAAALATGVAYLRALTDAGSPIEDAFGHLEFRYAATADQFATVAKLRAARRLWARVAEVCGVAGLDDPDTAPRFAQKQHAVTSSVMMTRRDPWVNLLRTTLAAFGAGVGGADAVTVQPFDAALGLPDAFSRRIARNTSSLLVMEAHLARVTDPAGGSWYVEQLTEALATAAWDRFTALEKAGGMAAALDSGRFAAQIAEVWDRRAGNLAHRRDPITGVSEFPLLDEVPVVREPWPPRPAGGLPVHRHAEEFEALRDAAQAHHPTPRVFLATLGPVAAHTARAGFAAGLFQAGGLETPSNGTRDVVAAFVASGATIACLASGDAVYAEQASPVALALKEAGARHVLLAGKGDYPGVDGYLRAGTDALAVLREVHRWIGIEDA
ncbi:methylmalonyl-CoA mutase [Kineosporia sp. J2-2]|uniref:Methylmalonyl-CoA mutase n=1 Tax=Kineosporia corallincola TaxID=2835133 RepID=A0ABS5TAP6_9ACTN|nr:methylmalonyl-CoA mutase family protein [Kineosporia corallincola]MBT0768136.1 methylmalonyl-CoA mutase [Kineosporia corallincola]